MNEKTVEFYTPCRDCVFAIFNEEVTKQVGCELSRLEKFKSLNKVSSKKDAETGLEYSVINTACTSWRPREWATQIENPIEKVKQEIKIKMGFIILGDKDDKKVFKTLNSIVAQTLKPEKISIVFFQRNKTVKDLLKVTREHNIKSEIVNVLDKQDLLTMSDYGVSKLQYTQFYSICKEDFVYPRNFSEKLNKLINEDLKQISMVVPTQDINGLTIQTKLHQLFGGNYDYSLQDKIRVKATEQNKEHMIIKYEDLING